MEPRGRKEGDGGRSPKRGSPTLTRGPGEAGVLGRRGGDGVEEDEVLMVMVRERWVAGGAS